MVLSYFTLAVALSLSIVAAWYSIVGLTAIFAAAVIPIIIMGSILEIAKITVTIWLHEYWHRCRLAMKLYLVPAVAMLMLLTSMGIFGFLSKAHTDQSLISGDVQSRIAIYDEKIKIERENIDANRKALKQLDEAVDQIMGRSTSETGAEKAVQIRRSQQAERGRLLREIEQSQKRIGTLNEERAPIAAEVRKVEAEVGPIKYIAALVYGDNPDTNLLERAVRWMIIMIVLVFDPLALALILAANKQFEWVRQGRGGWDHDDPKYPADDGALTDEQMQQFQQHLDQKRAVARALDSGADLPVPKEDVATELPWFEKYPYLAKPFVHFANLKPMVAADPSKKNYEIVDPDEDEDSPEIKAAKTAWKEQNPNDTLKHQRQLLAQGKITELPWMRLVADSVEPRQPVTGFGNQFPSNPIKGDTFVRVDQMPSVVYKFNGLDWILIDKNSTDSYTYDNAYIDHLIQRIAAGQYDPDLLSEGEREQVQQRLENNQT